MTHKIFSDFSGESYTKDTSFTWTILNPCISTDYVNIIPPTDLGLLNSYIILSGDSDLTAHEAFTVDTKPLVGHSLCGDLAYVAKYEGVELDGVNQPLIAYDSTTGVFTANSDDETLIDTFGTFSLDVTFANYSPDVAEYAGVTTATSSGQVEFIDPCLDPFEFSTVSQGTPTDADYKSQSSDFTVTQFNI